MDVPSPGNGLSFDEFLARNGAAASFFFFFLLLLPKEIKREINNTRDRRRGRDREKKVQNVTKGNTYL